MQKKTPKQYKIAAHYKTKTPKLNYTQQRF